MTRALRFAGAAILVAFPGCLLAQDARADADIKADVTAALRADADLASLAIGVDVRDGVVTLTGTAQNDAQLTRAENDISRIAGIVSIQDNINPGAATGRPDDVQRRGYDGGYRMGESDVEHARPFDLARHTPYQTPPVPAEQWDEFRAAYTQGYRAAYGYAATAPAANAAPPEALLQVRQRGYDEGYRMGIGDVQHARRFDVSRHTPFQYPPVPPDQWQVYRDGYRYGYRVAFGRAEAK